MHNPRLPVHTGGPLPMRFVAPTRLVGLIAVLVLLAISGCASVKPMEPGALHNPSLHEIYRAFAQGVARAKADPDIQWRSGWAGNIWINTSGDGSRGLCYQWQRWVYKAVLPTVERVRWHATGIMINQGTVNEHHAVLVFNPRVVDQKTLLRAPAGRPAYVLDAWRRGKPDVYLLEDWLQLPLTVRVPPRLTAVRVD